MKDLRPVLAVFNLRVLAEKTEVPYSTLKAYSSGHQKSFNITHYNRIISFINSLAV